MRTEAPRRVSTPAPDETAPAPALPARGPSRSRTAPQRRSAPARILLIHLLALLVLALACAASIAYGSRPAPWGQVWEALHGAGEEHLQAVVAARIPRTVVGAVVGAALALSGVLIQALTRNPLAEPGLLGITMGASASMVTVVAVVGPVSGVAAAWTAVPGAVLAVAVVQLIGARARGGSVVPLILAGAVVSAVLGAYVQAMILLRPDTFDSYRHWVVGSLAGARLETLTDLAPMLLLGALLSAMLVSGLNTLALGEGVAVSLGVRVGWLRLGTVAAVTLLAAAATAAIGPVAFVGLAVPHLVRGIVGSDVRLQATVSVLVGAALLVASDVVARVILRPEELMVGMLTAFIGAPLLLLAVRRGKVRL
ncbi:FecCD family ABC transporter permease [Nesterenkonia suensis]